MNRNDNDTNRTSRTPTSPTAIQADTASKQAASGKSGARSEPQSGSPADNASKQHGTQRGQDGSSSGSQR